MRSSRGPLDVSDAALLGRAGDIALLRAVAAGRVVRGAGAGGQTSIWAPHYLDGVLVRPDLRRLAAHDLIELPISGPPTLAPHGRKLLALADYGAGPPVPG